MKSKLITILLGVCIIPFTLFTVACSDTNEIEKLQMYISELMEDVDKLEERLDGVVIDAEVLEFIRAGAVAEIRDYIGKADGEYFFTDSNWQRIEAIENKAVEIINKADDYTTIKHAVENAAIEINEVETVTATAVEYSLQDAVDSELIAYDTLLKMADINNHFGPYNEFDLKPKYTDAIKEAYGKAENLAKDEIYIEYFGEYPVSGSDNSFLACIVFPDSQGSAPERYAVEIGGVEFWFLPGCEITIWCIELDG